MDNSINGAIEDPRSIEEKEQDFSSEEILGGSLVQWQPKSIWDTSDIRRQSTSTSCGAQSGAKVTTKFFGEIMSANPIFLRRKTFPRGSMYLHEIGEILRKFGTCLEKDSPSQNMTDEEMNKIVMPANLQYGIDSYYFINSITMDNLANALLKGHALILGIRSNAESYGNVPEPTGTDTFSHFVSCISENNFLLWNGEKAIVIEESSNIFSTINQQGQRIFTESFIKQKCWGVLAIIPKKGITRDLTVGSRGDEVRLLQDFLKKEGCMSLQIESTGYFGNITKRGVIKLQEKYADKILSPLGLSKGTGNVRKYTREFINANL